MSRIALLPEPENPDYWGYDEKYPQNRLPYVDEIRVLIIPENATILAAMRTGKADFNMFTSIDDVESIKRSNPENRAAPLCVSVE